MKQIALLLPVFFIAACSAAETDMPPPKKAEVLPVNTAPAAPMSLEERGAKIYKRCRACHTLDQEGRNKVGPNLWAIYGAQAGEKEGFAYSKAMLASGITWTEDTMDGYLKKPSEYMPGNKMTFIGLKKQEDRDAVQAYLRAETTPKPETP
jgi:cytochrome c